MDDPIEWFRAVDLLGVAANALLGGRLARTLRFDLVGFLIIGVISGLGGGILRDVLLTTRPVALVDLWYLGTAIAASILAFLMSIEGKWTLRVLLLADFLALGAWSATGVARGFGAGLALVPAVLLGVVTAVGGSSIRDIAVGRIPAIFVAGNSLNATIAAIGATEMALFTRAGYPNIGMAAAIVTCALVGAVARRQGWGLPAPIDIQPSGRAARERLARQRQRLARKRQRNTEVGR